MIAVHDVRKAFGATHALRGISFEARDGQVLGLLGANGAGKTTALRIIARILKPDTGTTTVEGELGVVTAGAGLYPRLTAREHITYFAELRGMRPNAIADRTKSLARDLQMHDLLDRRVAGFSQGEKLKVNIARALVHDPKNVLLDEPTNGLDVPSTRAMRGIIQALKAQGRCVIVSTHIMQEVAAVCDHVVIVARGAAIAEGTVPELIQRTGTTSLEDAFVSLVDA
jgi:sodium transport system ATP-binding protein